MSDQYTPTQAGENALHLAKEFGTESSDRMVPLLQPMNAEERVLFFANWFGVMFGHMKAALGHEGARGVIDALKLLADGNTANSEIGTKESAASPKDNDGLR